MKLFKGIRAGFWKLVYDRTGSLKALGRYRTIAHIVKQPTKRFTVVDLQKADLASTLHRGARVAHVINTVITKPVKKDLIGDQQYLVNEMASCAVLEGQPGRGDFSPVVTDRK